MTSSSQPHVGTPVTRVTPQTQELMSRPIFQRVLFDISELFQQPSQHTEILAQALHRYTVALARKHNISLDPQERLHKRPRSDADYSHRDQHQDTDTADEESDIDAGPTPSAPQRVSSVLDHHSTADHAGGEAAIEEDPVSAFIVKRATPRARRGRLVSPSAEPLAAADGKDNNTEPEPDGDDDEINDGTAWIESRLHKSVLPVSADLDSSAAVEARSRFCHRIRALQIPASKSNSQTTLRFRDAEVVEIANFFFSDMIGPKALERLSTLVETYAVENGHLPDVRSAARASTAASDPRTPADFRPFFGAYSKAAENCHGEDSIFRQIKQTEHDLDFLAEYNALKTRAENRDSKLIELLNNCGIQAKTGWSIMTRVLKYITQTLQMTSSQLSNFVQAIQAVDSLVRQFTRGVIILLPPGYGKRLYRWGNQRMAAVYPVFNQEVPAFRELCCKLDDVLLSPILRGSRLPFLRIETGSDLSLKQCIEQAQRVEEVDEEAPPWLD